MKRAARLCRSRSKWGVCHRPPHTDGPHGTLIGGGSDPVGGDPEVWFLWASSRAPIGYCSAPIREKKR